MLTSTKIGALLELPVHTLTTEYKDLLKLLTVPNPASKNNFYRNSRYAKNSIPTHLYFYNIHQANKSISVPRNIDETFYTKGTPIIEVSEGREIVYGATQEFKLRPVQDEFINTIILPYIYNNTNKEYLDILINAECGSGKTVLSLYLSAIYKRSTLVVVTTKNIGNKFISTVKDLFPNWTCGWEDGKKQYDITIATYSLLSDKRYDETYYEQFGHTVLDEYHRCGAASYNAIMDRCKCKYRTSMTATFRRKDGLHKILKLHAGEIMEMERVSEKATIYPVITGFGLEEGFFRVPARESTKLDKLSEFMQVVIKDRKTRAEQDRGMISKVEGQFVTILSLKTHTPVSYDFEFSSFHEIGSVSASMIDTEISSIDKRDDLIFNLIRQLARSGRKIIVLSKRKEQLFKMQHRLTRYGFRSGIVVSESDQDYKDYCKRFSRTLKENSEYVFNECQIILGIDKLAEEGMDAPSFDTLLYLHPIRDIEQSIGRILRQYDGKFCAEAYYLIDKIGIYENAFYDAKKGACQMFKKLGHTVENEIYLTDYGSI